jgi:hypothetical protein
MSHFTNVKTQMVEKEYLLKALQDLGYFCEVGTFKLRSWEAGSTPVEIKLRTGFFSGAIGFRKQGTTYEVVADAWGARRVRKTDLVRQVTQRYAYHAARAKLEAQGFALVTEETRQDGQIHLVLRRIAQ